VLDAEVVAMSSSEAAEFSKLADTTYRDVNIALANEFARAADLHGIDVQEVIAAANSQPYSHIHQPGIGVGGHCIPVYPHLLLARAPGLSLVETARHVNDGQVDRALAILDPLVGGLAGAPILVLGVTYREGVKELAYSRAIALIDALKAAGARVSAFDPLLTDDEVAALGAEPWHWSDPGSFRAIVSQTADRVFAGLDAAWFPALRAVYDGRNSLRELALPAGVTYVGVGVQAATRTLQS
jgi:UDP-N-acetyl-D-mannosaminuronic acid dehydrogenase